MVNITSEAQLKTLWLPYQILSGKSVKNIKIDPQATDMWSTTLNVAL